jgi:hypothetical protein
MRLLKRIFLDVQPDLDVEWLVAEEFFDAYWDEVFPVENEEPKLKVVAW